MPRHSCIAWMAVQGRLRNKDRLLRVGENVDADCFLCGQADEEAKHVFFLCPVSSICMTVISRWVGINYRNQEDTFTMWRRWERTYKSKHRREIVYATLAAMVYLLYYIWQARNEVLWYAKLVMPSVLMKRMQYDVCSRVKA